MMTETGEGCVVVVMRMSLTVMGAVTGLGC